jgi:hypothetical protein
MSADNTIVILKLKDQWRVKHVFALDNLRWKYGDSDPSPSPLSSRVFEYFRDAKIFYNSDASQKEAEKLLEKIGYVEYGIAEVEMDLSWEELVSQARSMVKEEKLSLLSGGLYVDKKTIFLDQLNHLYSDILKEEVLLKRKKEQETYDVL